MNIKGPIIIIEDDSDDREILGEILKEICENKIVFCQDGEEALNYLTNLVEEPFIVISDINMPKLSGFDLREKIQENEDLRIKCIPYLFFTTSAEQNDVINAYSKSIQGFFVKPNSFTKIKETMISIIGYWSKCVSPNYTK